MCKYIRRRTQHLDNLRWRWRHLVAPPDRFHHIQTSLIWQKHQRKHAAAGSEGRRKRWETPPASGPNSNTHATGGSCFKPGGTNRSVDPLCQSEGSTPERPEHSGGGSDHRPGRRGTEPSSDHSSELPHRPVYLLASTQPHTRRTHRVV